MTSFNGGAFPDPSQDINLRAANLTAGAFQDPTKTISERNGIKPLSAYFRESADLVIPMMDAQRENDLVTSLRAANRIDPEKAGEAQRVAQRLGLDASVPEDQLNIALELDREKQIRQQELAKKYPYMARQLSNVNFASIEIGRAHV